MSFWDAAINIGMQIVGGALTKDKGSSTAVATKKSLPALDNSKFMSKNTKSVMSKSDRRGLDPTARARTVREKNEEPETENEGADAVALARIWNEVFGDETR